MRFEFIFTGFALARRVLGKACVGFSYPNDNLLRCCATATVDDTPLLQRLTLIAKISRTTTSP